MPRELNYHERRRETERAEHLQHLADIIKELENLRSAIEPFDCEAADALANATAPLEQWRTKFAQNGAGVLWPMD